MDSTTRSDTLAAPPGAGRIPALLLVAVLLAVGGAIVVGVRGRWFLAILVPVAVFSLYMAIRVATTMVGEIRAGRSAPSSELEQKKSE